MIRTPQEKKRLSLERDHPLSAKYPHAFRKSWPRKKRKVQKAFRHAVKQRLGAGKGTVDLQVDGMPDLGGIRRKKKQKWGAFPLGVVIQQKKQRRILSYRRKKNAKLGINSFSL